MQLDFYKYQGTGNDFILIDNRSGAFSKKDELIQQLCDRKFGIGADGLMLVENHDSADFRMIYYNADGSQSLCGNGSRCAVAFANYLGIIGSNTYFETTDGFHHAEILEDRRVKFELLDVNDITRYDDRTFFIDTGSPHHIELSENVEKIDIKPEGSAVRYSKQYEPAGTNVNFVEQLPGRIKVRTYERGVEDETLSCGTGVTACALMAHQLGYQSPVTIETAGGQLQVFFEEKQGKYTNIFLAGPAVQVFQGTIKI
jgi:diaminopimelate epimerase